MNKNDEEQAIRSHMGWDWERYMATWTIWTVCDNDNIDNDNKLIIINEKYWTIYNGLLWLRTNGLEWFVLVWKRNHLEQLKTIVRAVKGI